MSPASVKAELDIGPTRLQRTDRYYDTQEPSDLQLRLRNRITKELSVELTRVTVPECGRCGQGFVDAVALQHHDIVVHELPLLRGKKKWPSKNDAGETVDTSCPTCKKTFKTRSALHSHYKMHTRTLRYTCLLCSATCTSNADLIQHKRHHHIGELYTCLKCHVTFDRSEQYVSHAADHMLRAIYRCEECTKAFGTKVQLKVHAKVHSVDVKLYSCQVCDRRFNTIMDLKFHEASHTGAKPFECPSCNETFASKANLLAHSTYHKAKSHCCAKCGKVFATAQRLRTHVIIHTGERPFKCPFCERRFKQSGDMQRHAVSHGEDPKPFKCAECGKGFKSKQYLVGHVTVHSGTERFKCLECGVKFSTKTGLRTHTLYKHTTEKRFRCTYENCDVSTKTKSDLKRHVRNVHNKKS